MAYLDPRNYVPSVKEMVNYGCDIHWDGYTVMKNHGDYIRLMFPSSAAKGHIFNYCLTRHLRGMIL